MVRHLSSQLLEDEGSLVDMVAIKYVFAVEGRERLALIVPKVDGLCLVRT